MGSAVTAALFAGTAAAADFAATWVEFDGEQAYPVGRILRNGDRLRLESVADSDPAAIWVGDLDSGQAWLIDSDGRGLDKGRLPASLTQRWPLRLPVEQRCQDPAWRCERLESSGAAAGPLSVWRAWEFQGGQFGRGGGWRESLVWQRDSDSVVVREQWAEGRSVQLLEESSLDHQGRGVVLRHYLTTNADGTRWHSRYWYDAELGQVVREDAPDGRSRWLEDFQIGAQPDHLFSLPSVARPAPGAGFGPGIAAMPRETMPRTAPVGGPGDAELPPPPPTGSTPARENNKAGTTK